MNGWEVVGYLAAGFFLTILLLFFVVVVVTIVNSVREHRKEKKVREAVEREDLRTRARSAYFEGLGDEYGQYAREADQEGLEAVYKAGFEAGKHTKVENKEEEEADNTLSAPHFENMNAGDIFSVGYEAWKITDIEAEYNPEKYETRLRITAKSVGVGL